MAFANVYEAVDAANRTYGLPRSGPPIASAARFLIDLSGNVVSPDDLSGTSHKVSPYTPVTTDSISASTSKKNETIYLTPAGTIAAATFVFPTNANSSLGQTIRLISHQIVTALTVTANGNTLLGTAVTALAVDTPVAWQKIAASTWIRI